MEWVVKLIGGGDSRYPLQNFMSIEFENLPNPISEFETHQWANYSSKAQEWYYFTDDPETIDLANLVEQKAWDYKDLGPSDENRKYDEQSRVIVARKDKEIVGVARIFGHGDKLIPALSEMDFENELHRQALINDLEAGRLEEFGILARDHQKSKKRLTARNLYRTAWKEARSRGVEGWVMIMEPERAEKDFARNGIPFTRISETKWYQGGEVATHLLHFEEAIENVTSHYNPLVRRALRKIEYEPLSNSF